MSSTTPVLGINYEGGKAIHAARTSSLSECVAAFNCQIAMDAPFQAGEEAPEEVRCQGRAEAKLGASDERIAEQLLPVLQQALDVCVEKEGGLLVQVARGRSAQPFWQEVIQPTLDQCVPGTKREIVPITFLSGYRTTDYPDFDAVGRPFVYLNIGMFGRLSADVAPGDVFAVASTVVIDPGSSLSHPTIRTVLNHRGEDDALQMLPHCCLLSIPDTFPFVTPELYDHKTIMALVGTTENGVISAMQVEEDIEHVSAQISDLQAFTVTAIRSDGGETEVAVSGPTQEVHAAVRLAFGRDINEMYVDFGGEAVAEGETFEDRDIENGARLEVRVVEASPWTLLHSGWIPAQVDYIHPHILALGQFITPNDEPVTYQQVLLEGAAGDSAGNEHSTGIFRVITLLEKQKTSRPADKKAWSHVSVDYMPGDVKSSRPETYSGWAGDGWNEMHIFGPGTRRFIVRPGQVHVDQNYSSVGGEENNPRLGKYARVWVRDSTSRSDLPVSLSDLCAGPIKTASKASLNS